MADSVAPPLPETLADCTLGISLALVTVPKVENLLFATGCASLGIAGSAAVGRWLANWVTRGDPGEDLSGVAPERFGQKGRDKEWIWRESRKFYANYYSIPSMAVT